MKVIFIRNNSNLGFLNFKNEGYIFKPLRKNINSLTVINNKLIKDILLKKINRSIENVNKAINLMIKSDITEVNDCKIMEDELKRIMNNLNNKYISYFNEFEYFEFIKQIYILNNVINAKKILIKEL